MKLTHHNYGPDHAKYVVQLHISPINSVDKLHEIIEWCYRTYGSPGWRTDTYEVVWTAGGGKYPTREIMFNKESNMALFILRWS